MANDKVALTFNPKTGVWDKGSANTIVESPASSGDSASPSKSASTSKETGSGKTKEKADKEIQDKEINTLVGEIPLVPNEVTLALKSGDTVNLLGLGKYLSGLYFISKVTHSVNSGGYNLTIEVRKSEFLGMKKGAEIKVTTPANVARTPEVAKKVDAFKKGDLVKIEGNAVYTNAGKGVSVPEWVKSKTLTIQQLSSDGSTALVQPINSWTYVKFLKKV